MDTFEESAMEKAPTITCKCLIYLARPEGFEPPTYRFVVVCIPLTRDTKRQQEQRK